MKIGILTFHSADNYGAILQCYALQKYLQGLNLEVDIINYRPNYIVNVYKAFSLQRIHERTTKQTIKKLLKEILLFPRAYIKHNNFNRFRKKFLSINSDTKISDKYDIYISGSDQIWSPGITGLDKTYFCEFDFLKNDKKYISYAASMNNSSLSENEKEIFKKLLCNFDYISVREKSIKNILQPLIDKEIAVTLDPTLLIDETEWNKLAISPYKNKSYIVLYQVVPCTEAIEIAKQIAKINNYDLLVIGAWISTNVKERQTLSPEKFIGAIKDAELVLTTSFHGTVFSIIFKKQFFVLDTNGKNNPRIDSLLSSLELSDRIISNDKYININTPINWENTNLLLERQRCKSFNFIKNSLGIDN